MEKGIKLVGAVMGVVCALALGGCQTVAPRLEPPVVTLPPTPLPTSSPAPSATPEPEEAVAVPSPVTAVEMEILVYSDRTGNNQIYILDCASGEKRRLAESDASDTFPSWSPDRERVVFTSDRDGNQEIYLVYADGSGLERLTDSPGPDNFPVWAPDNRTIAYFSSRDGADNLWQYDTVDGSSRPLTGFTEGSGGVIVFSPDGSKLFFGYDRLGRYKIYQLELPGGEPKEIITHGLRNSRMSCLAEPDGLALLYVSGKAGQDDIWMSYVDDGRFINITRDAAPDHSPTLTPDGRAVVFSSLRAGENWQLFLVNRSGRPVDNQVTRLTDDGFNYWYPHVR